MAKNKRRAKREVARAVTVEGDDAGRNPDPWRQRLSDAATCALSCLWVLRERRASDAELRTYLARELPHWWRLLHGLLRAHARELQARLGSDPIESGDKAYATAYDAVARIVGGACLMLANYAEIEHACALVDRHDLSRLQALLAIAERALAEQPTSIQPVTAQAGTVAGGSVDTEPVASIAYDELTKQQAKVALIVHDAGTDGLTAIEIAQRYGRTPAGEAATALNMRRPLRVLRKHHVIELVRAQQRYRWLAPPSGMPSTTAKAT